MIILIVITIIIRFLITENTIMRTREVVIEISKTATAIIIVIIIMIIITIIN